MTEQFLQNSVLLMNTLLFLAVTFIKSSFFVNKLTIWIYNENDDIYFHKKTSCIILYLRAQKSYKNHKLIYLYDMVIGSPIYCHYDYSAIKQVFLLQVTTIKTLTSLWEHLQLLYRVGYVWAPPFGRWIFGRLDYRVPELGDGLLLVFFSLVFL